MHFHKALEIYEKKLIGPIKIQCLLIISYFFKNNIKIRSITSTLSKDR
jgi:hypothetical protein